MENTLICCDWGTSTFRLRWVEADTGKVLHEVQSDEGIARTFAAWQASTDDRVIAYRHVLRKYISQLARTAGNSLKGVPVVISGMASSSLGMVELSYADLPFSVDGNGAVVRQMAPASNFPHEIILISGVRSERDVMRGEETQLVGIYSLWRKELAGTGSAATTLILPGTHSKHIQVRYGAMTCFRTYMTGELFALLTQYSILKDSIRVRQGYNIREEDWAWFRRGVRAAARANLLHALFSVRVNGLFEQFSPEMNYAYLSGLLIGSELQDLTGQGQSFWLASGSHLYPFYESAMHELGLTFTCVPAELMEQAAVAGQLIIFRNQRKEDPVCC